MMGWGKNQKKIHARENAKKKNSCKEEGKKKFMQKEGPIVTFSRVVKKIRAEGFTWKKKSCKLKIPTPPPPPSLF